jgi:hypothetical protein
MANARRALPASGAHGAFQGLSRRHYFAAVIVAAMATDVMRTLQLAAIGAFRMRLGAQGMVTAPHSLSRRRGLSLGNGHRLRPPVWRQTSPATPQPGVIIWQ